MDRRHRISAKNLSTAERDKAGSKKIVTLQARQPDSQRQTLSVEEAGKILGISRGAAYAYAKDGSLPTIRLGSRLLVPKAALDKMLMTA
jgi:excisionase family DNA binding protein